MKIRIKAASAFLSRQLGQWSCSFIPRPVCFIFWCHRHRKPWDHLMKSDPCGEVWNADRGLRSIHLPALARIISLKGFIFQWSSPSAGRASLSSRDSFVTGSDQTIHRHFPSGSGHTLHHRRVSDIKPSAIHHTIQPNSAAASNSKLEPFTLQFTPHFGRLWLDPNSVARHLSCLYLPSAVAPLQFVITAPAISPLSPVPWVTLEVPGPRGPVVCTREHWTLRWYILGNCEVMAATLLSYVPAHLGDAEKTERKLL